MSKVVVTEYVTLDGVMQDPGGAEKDKFQHGGWTTSYWGDDISKFKYDELFASGALLLGRVTYQGFAAAWPTMEGTGEYGERMNSLPKYVVSTTLQRADWNNSHIIKTNVAEDIARLKQQEGQDILIFGSARLAQSLMQANLVDQFNLLVYPVVLGSGKRLFQDVSKTALKLVEAKAFASGVAGLIYQVERAT